MGLIAREIEAGGIPTLSMTSAWSITRAVNPPRAAFLDFPLGHTTGKPNDPVGQRAILADALGHFETISEPGTIERLTYEWSEEDTWKERVVRPEADANTAEAESRGDDRVPRYDTPQYQNSADRDLADAALASDGCPSCVFLEEPSSTRS